MVPCGDASPMGRSDKAASRTADTHAAEESDGLVVPSKRANNADEARPRAAAESVEGRGPAKGNEERSPTDRPQRRKHQSRGLLGVRFRPATRAAATPTNDSARPDGSQRQESIG